LTEGLKEGISLTVPAKKATTKKVAKKKKATVKRPINPGLAAINEQKKKMAKRHRELDDLEAEKSKLEKTTAIENLRNKMRVAELCDEMDYNPLKSIIENAMSGDLSPSDQLKVDFKLVDKLVGDVKSVEGGEEGDKVINIQLQSFADSRLKDFERPKRPAKEYEDFEGDDTKVQSGQSHEPIQCNSEPNKRSSDAERDLSESEGPTEAEGGIEVPLDTEEASSDK
jgi:hypothetical protein